jgi:hypothetical protein
MPADLPVIPTDFIIEHLSLSGRWGNQAGQHTHRGSFAGAIGANKAKDFPFGNVQGQPINGYVTIEFPCQILCSYHGKLGLF